MCFFFNDTATTEIYTLSLHDALPIWVGDWRKLGAFAGVRVHLIAGAGFDQDGVIAGADEVAVESERDTVEFVDRGLAAPEGFGNDAEEGAAIPPVDGIADQREREIAQLGVVGGGVYVAMRPSYPVVELVFYH